MYEIPLDSAALCHHSPLMYNTYKIYKKTYKLEKVYKIYKTYKKGVRVRVRVRDQW